MSVFRIEKTKNFTVMSNIHLQDKNLSLKAKGLLSQMLSLPDDWDYTLRGLATINKEAVNTIGGIVKELIAAGYIVREQSRTEGGCFAESTYVIYEVPHMEQDYVEEESIENNTVSPRLKNCDTVQNQKNQVSSPYLKNCDTVKTLENRGIQPCRKKRYTDSCDNNKILNKQNIDIYNPSIHSSNTTRMRDLASALPKESNESKTADTYEQYIQLVKDNISYDDLLTTMPEYINTIDGIVNIMLEVLLSKNKFVRISKEDKPIQLVKSKYLKLKYEHIVYVIECMQKNNTLVRDMKAYMRSVLYNASDTMELYYSNAVNHDFYGPQDYCDSG